MRIVIFITSLFILNGLFAQDLSYCGTGIDAESEKFLTDYFEGKYPLKTRNALMWVPMTAHIVSKEGGTAPYDERDVLEALCTLNEDYSGTNIQFYLSSFQYIYNDVYYDHDYSDGIKMMQENNIFGTANAYFVSSPAGNCGYFAGAGGAVALAFSCTQKNDHTWAHEMGHYLSLPHTFRGWEGEDYVAGEVAPNYIGNRKVERAGTDPDCDISGDRFCDTPADYLSYRWTCNSNGESSTIQLDPDSVSFRSDGTYIMSYSNDACVDKFSPTQIEAMESNLQNTKSEQIDHNYSPPPNIIAEETVPFYPINDEIVTENSTILEWSELGSAKYYYLQVSKFPLFQFPLVEEWVTDLTYEITDLQDDKTYYWRITAYNDSGFCGEEGTTNSFKTSFVVSNEDDFIDNDVYIYPNPTSGEFIIKAETPFSGMYTIYNNQLQLIEQSEINHTNRIECKKDLLAGIYIIQVFNGKNTITRKLIVQ